MGVGVEAFSDNARKSRQSFARVGLTGRGEVVVRKKVLADVGAAFHIEPSQVRCAFRTPKPPSGFSRILMGSLYVGRYGRGAWIFVRAKGDACRLSTEIF